MGGVLEQIGCGRYHLVSTDSTSVQNPSDSRVLVLLNTLRTGFTWSYVRDACRTTVATELT